MSIAAILVLGRMCFAQAKIELPGMTTTTLIVEVVNGTKGGTSTEGDFVEVIIYRDNIALQALESTADVGGKAVFENVQVGPGITVMPKARHKEMSFTGKVIPLKAGAETTTAVVEVFEVSGDNSQIVIEMHHFVIDSTANHLLITEFMMLRNPTDMAISSDKKDADGRNMVIEAKLPAGFTNITSSYYFVMDALVITEDGFYDTLAIPPGKYQSMFSYNIPITSETMELTKEITIPTKALIVFSKLESGRVKGYGQATGRMSLGDGNTAEYFEAKEYKPGDKFELYITGFTVSGGGDSSVMVLSIVFGLIGLAALSRFIRTYSI